MTLIGNITILIMIMLLTLQVQFSLKDMMMMRKEWRHMQQPYPTIGVVTFLKLLMKLKPMDF